MRVAESGLRRVMRVWRRVFVCVCVCGGNIGGRSVVGRVGDMGIYPCEMDEAVCVVTEGGGMYAAIKELIGGMKESKEGLRCGAGMQSVL